MNLKKLILICAVIALPTAVSAEEFKKTVNIDMYIGAISNFKPEKPEFALYSSENELLASHTVDMNSIGTHHELTFEIPEYQSGEGFYLSCLNGVDCVQYCDDYYGVGSKILLETYNDYENQNGETISGNHFSLTAYPLQEKTMHLRLNSYKYNLSYPLKLINGSAMISLVDTMNIFDLWQDKTIFDDVSGKLEINAFDKSIVMTLGKTEALAETASELNAAPLRIGGLMYVPLRFTAEALGAVVSSNEADGILTVDIDMIKLLHDRQNAFINSKNMDSKTNYLIWVDKSDFTVTVFKGTKNNWNAVNVFPCTIGKPSTPTVTGVFEYYAKQDRWTYPNYYVGPIMRFRHGGYAFHSTLIKYDGTPYDGRLQKMLSLGCVRMAPQDIRYMFDTIPLHTRVYITE